MLDRLVSPSIRLGSSSVSAFHLCGVIGSIASLIAAVVLACVTHLSVGLLVMLWAVSLLLFLGLALATKLFTGEETLVYYRHEVAILATAAAIIWLTGKPLLPYLDVTVVGIGTFLIFGRVGCYAVGCCHGKPSLWGVRYRHEHAEQGFPEHLVGVKLLPIQLIESACVVCIVAVACILLVRRSAYGTTLVWYTLAYGALRFIFEFFRGDGARPQFMGFSEAQWWSLLLGLGVLVSICSGQLPPVLPREIAGAAALLVCAVPIFLYRWTTSLARRLVAPAHVAELASAIEPMIAQTDRAKSAGSNPVVAPQTSLGLRVSYARHLSANGILHQYTLSLRTGSLAAAGAQSLAVLIATLRHGGIPYRLVTRDTGVVHVLIHQPRPIPSSSLWLDADVPNWR